MLEELWQPRRIIEEQYRKALTRLMDGFLNILKAIPIIEPSQILDKLREYTDSETFLDLGRAAANRMITGLYQDGSKTWREAARQSGKGALIYRQMQREMEGPLGWRIKQLVDENATLISTFPNDIATLAAHFIKREAQKGRRAEFIAEDLMRQFPDVSEGRINLIARTETAKANTALTQARSESLGIDWFVWRTSKDARVRSTHRHMDGVLCSWKELPSPEALLGASRTHGYYGPGQIFNCRCYPQVLISASDVAWPHKCYWAGQIQYVTRARFDRISGGSYRTN